MLITQWRNGGAIPTEAPGRRPEERAGDDGAAARDLVAVDDPRGAHAVFGLLGARPASGTRPVGAAAGNERAAARDLIDMLHDQYRRALDDPQASFADDWAAPVAVASCASTELVYGESSEASVEALLSGGRSLEQAFGPLVKGGEPDLAEPVTVPEILRLFAPADYHAAAARRSPALPPALARREHHAAGLDSPLLAPRASCSQEETL